MPTLSTLLGFSAATLVLVALPGPNMFYILGNGIAGGRRIAVASAVGVEFGSMLHVIAAAVGLSGLVRSSAMTYSLVRYLGIAYLAYLGVRALRGSRGSTAIEGTKATALQGLTFGRTLRRGLIVNVLNPKVSLFFLAFLPQFIDPTIGTAAQQTLILGALFVAIALAIDLLSALGSGWLAQWFDTRPKLFGFQERVAGIIYLGLAGLSALHGERGSVT